MRHTATIRLFASAATVAFGMAFAGGALAQDSGDAVQVEEIVVTAQKREQNLQDVPVAVSAFGEKQLEAQAVGSLTDLSSVEGVSETLAKKIFDFFHPGG